MSDSDNIHSIWEIDTSNPQGIKDLECFLLNNGDPNETKIVYQEYHWTKLAEAASEDNIEVVKVLLKFGAYVDYTGSELGSFGPPILIASGLGFQETCKLLIDAGTDVNIPGKGILFPGTLNIPHISTQPLHRAAENGHAAIIQLLMEHGADAGIVVNAIPVIGTYDTAIAAASRGGHFEAVQALIEGGADVNFQHPRGYSALHNAASYGHFEIVQYLVEQGAALNPRGGVFGMTPLYLVQGRRDRHNIEQYLKAHGGIAYIHWWYYLLLLMGGSFSGFGP
jgi:ankyrin repeat protein